MTNDAIDAVVIASPAVTHYELAKAALLSGKDVFVEKPLALDVSAGKELVDLAADQQRVLMVGHSERFNPVILALEKYDLEPRFIDSQRVSPFSFRSADIGVVLDMMIHDLDLVTYRQRLFPIMGHQDHRYAPLSQHRPQLTPKDTAEFGVEGTEGLIQK